jgi:hypothetical protein
MDSDAEETIDTLDTISLPTGTRPGDMLGQQAADGEASDLDVDVVWEEEDRPAVLKRVRGRHGGRKGVAGGRSPAGGQRGGLHRPAPAPAAAG